jgi:hypothetical protein
MGARAATETSTRVMAGPGSSAPRVRVDPGRLRARIALLLEETAHQGLLALQLLLQARDLLGRFAASDDPRVAGLVADLEQRLLAVERQGRDRLRQVRRLLRGARA